jgi:succinyl-CoA synthetase beta subunit
MGVPTASINAAVHAMMALAKAYDELDCSLAEVNPLILTRTDALWRSIAR